MPDIVLADTITKLPAGAAGNVVVSGSHGGRYCGYLAAKGGVAAVILNDAGGGLDGAGRGALGYLQDLVLAGAVVDAMSCRVGDATDMIARGIISGANAAAAGLGVRKGMACAEAAECLRRALPSPTPPRAPDETRSEIVGLARRIVLVDSASLVEPGDAGQIVVTASHGGLIGGYPPAALKVDAFAAVFNDAGMGAEACGITRLPALEARGIAGLTVAAMSARIGDARSTFHDGIVSAVNPTAARLGAAVGERLEPILRRWADGG
ncbi:MAG: hypothetical protein J0H63_10020 [Rhizobiales bacterium]|nr:hypothetical protein [Hyphomicrobiales bacterium]